MRFSKKYDGAKTMTGEQREVVMALLELSKSKKRTKRSKKSSPRRSATKRRRSRSKSPSAKYKRIQSMRASGKW